MSRDEVLYTGATSAGFARTRKEVENIDKLEKQSKILPVAKLIDEEIQKQRDAIAKELGNIIHIEMSAEDIKSTVMGLRLADSKMIALQNSLRVIVNAKPLRKAKKTNDEL